jgi:hypothetical protein
LPITSKLLLTLYWKATPVGDPRLTPTPYLVVAAPTVVLSAATGAMTNAVTNRTKLIFFIFISFAKHIVHEVTGKIHYFLIHFQHFRSLNDTFFYKNKQEQEKLQTIIKTGGRNRYWI